MEPTEPKLSETQTEPTASNPVETSGSSSLETNDTSLENGPASNPVTTLPAPPSQLPKEPFLKRLLKRFNVYLVLFVVVIIATGIVLVIAFSTSKKSNTNTVQTQSLTESTLKQLAASDVTVGQPKQVLNVQSNAVFAGKVLIRDSLEVAGTIQVGSNLNLPGITVSGTSIFDQAQVNKNLTVSGDTALQGQLSVQKNLSAAGSGTFGGPLSAPQITANTLQLNGDLNLTHHITAGGATPGRSNGSALGSGGAASVSGSDTSGNVNINTGSGASAGCFITVYFTQKYNSTPHILITPVGSGAAAVNYYVDRTTSSFTICAASTPPSSASFGFDYFVLD